MTAPPRRIVSLVPSTTETVCALGARDLLVGVTRYCEEPPGRAATAAVVGGTKNPKLEQVAALQPDLVLVNTEENRREDIDWLRGRCRVLEQAPTTVVEAATAIRQLALALDRLAAAQPILARIDAAIAHAAAAASSGSVRAYYAVWPKPWMSCNARTFIHDVLARAGAANVCAGDPDRYPLVPPETARDRGVELVLLPSEPYPFTPEDVAAVRSEARFGVGVRVATCDGRDFCWHGARLADGLMRAVELLRAFRRPQ